MLRVLFVAAALLAALTTAPSASAQDGPVEPAKEAPRDTLPQADPLSPRIFLPPSQTKPPPSFAISAREAIRISARTKAVREAKRAHPDLKATAYISPLQLPQGGFYHWDIYWKSGAEEIVEVELGHSGTVFVVTKQPDIGWPLLLGSPGVLGGMLNAPYIWLPLCVLFLVPFFDPRRPFRLLHLDLVMLLLFGISQYFFTRGEPAISVPLVYPFLLYAAVRAGMAAFRPTRRSGPLMPHVSTRFLLVGVVVFLGLRIAFGVTESSTFDISTAGVIGADRIAHGLPLYQFNDAYGDTYGAVNYLMYMPWEAIFPFRVPDQIADAARAATLSFDFLVVVALFLIGRSLRPGPSGTRLGAGLAWAWVTFPYTALVIASNTNDALVPLFALFALLAIASPVGRGTLSAIGTMAKFAPGLLAPIFAAGRGPFRLRSALVVFLSYVVVCGGLIVAFLPDGGLEEFWNATLGFQLTRISPLSLWTRHPELDWIKPVLAGIGIILAVLAAFVPRRRTRGQIAALCAMVFATSQLATGYWLYFYIVWFAPFLFIALFEEYGDLGAQGNVTSDLSKRVKISGPSAVTTTRSSIRTPSTPGR